MKLKTCKEIASEIGVSESKVRKALKDGYLVPPPKFDAEGSIMLEGMVISNVLLGKYKKANGDTKRLKKWSGIYGTRMESINNIMITRLSNTQSSLGVVVANLPNSKYKRFVGRNLREAFYLAKEWCMQIPDFTKKMKRESTRGLAVSISLTYDEICYLKGLVSEHGRWNKLAKKIARAEVLSLQRKEGTSHD